MSFTDDASSALFSGMDMANRAGQAAKINIEKTRLSQQRQSLMRELGSVAFPALKSHPELVPEAQEVLTRIIALDQRVSSLDKELESLKVPTASPASSQSAAPTSDNRGATLVCPRCGNAIAPGDNFCMTCGLPRAEAEKQSKDAERDSEDTPKAGEGNSEGEPLAAPQEPAVEPGGNETAPDTTGVDPGETAEPEAQPAPPEEKPAVEEGRESDGREPHADESTEDAPQSTGPNESASAAEGDTAPTCYCPHCGHEVDAGAKFCMWCGGSLHPASN